MKTVFVLANPVDSHETLQSVIFHLGPHCQSTSLGVSSIQQIICKSVTIVLYLTGPSGTDKQN